MSEIENFQLLLYNSKIIKNKSFLLNSLKNRQFSLIYISSRFELVYFFFLDMSTNSLYYVTSPYLNKWQINLFKYFGTR